jgi:hypothetical protein
MFFWGQKDPKKDNNPKCKIQINWVVKCCLDPIEPFLILQKTQDGKVALNLY